MLGEQIAGVYAYGLSRSVSAGANFSASTATTETITVTRWGREGLQAGDWVMKGGKTYWNYFWSGKWQPSWFPGRNRPASFPSGQSFPVPPSSVRAPRIGDVGTELENAASLKMKEALGQRVYDPKCQ